VTTQTKRTPPVGYEWPGMSDSPYAHYYLEPQAAYDGATPQFMVMVMEPGMVRILAEKCFLKDAVLIVDALRDYYARDMGWSIS
jgi:hypothetical protein